MKYDWIWYLNGSQKQKSMLKLILSAGETRFDNNSHLYKKKKGWHIKNCKAVFLKIKTPFQIKIYKLLLDNCCRFFCSIMSFYQKTEYRFERLE